MTRAPDVDASHRRYRHEALFYAGREEFMSGTLGFIREAVSENEPILVVLNAEKIAALRWALTPELARRDDCVQFADMSLVGANPARIIPAWQRFVAEFSGSGGRVRGIGEPIWAERARAELTECERHEALLNVAFEDPDFWLLCPYDTEALPRSVLDEARRNHPFVREHDHSERSAEYPGVDVLAAPFDDPLSAPPDDARVLEFREPDLHRVRAFVAEFARTSKMPGESKSDLMLAAHEVAVNAVTHGADCGYLRLWRDGDGVVCEVRSVGGMTSDPLVDRTSPAPDAVRGRGLWIANQLCDLVQVRAYSGEVVVRLHVAERVKPDCRRRDRVPLED